MHFRVAAWFCDCAPRPGCCRWFVPKLSATVLKCKKIGDGPGSQQVRIFSFGGAHSFCRRSGLIVALQFLLDVQSLKEMLLHLSSFGENITLKPIYGKIVQKLMGKVESMLKIISSPSETLVSSYATLMPDGSAADFQRLLELRGVTKKQEQQMYIEQWESEMRKKAASSAKGSSEEFAL